MEAKLSQPAVAKDAIPVTADNFIRAETDMYFNAIAMKKGGFGKFNHDREPLPIDGQTVIRTNRDTLYSSVVVDLSAGPVTITFPDAGERFMSLQVINQDHYTTQVLYGAGSHTFNQDQIGTRYVLFAVRTLVDPGNPRDFDVVHALQDAITFHQPGGLGEIQVPQWDSASQKKVRDALLTLAQTLPDTRHAFGTKEQVDPVHRLIGAASAWGGNPDKEAMYLNVVPTNNDGKVVYRLTVKDVPVDGFWSISVYNAQGYFQENPQQMYAVNNLGAQKNPDGSITVQFGGCDGKTANCIPIMPGWNYMVRLYRPRPNVLDGSWIFPAATPAS